MHILNYRLRRDHLPFWVLKVMAVNIKASKVLILHLFNTDHKSSIFILLELFMFESILSVHLNVTKVKKVTEVILFNISFGLFLK